MTIKIELTDIENMQPDVLLRTAEFLTSLASKNAPVNLNSEAAFDTWLDSKTMFTTDEVKESDQLPVVEPDPVRVTNLFGKTKLPEGAILPKPKTSVEVDARGFPWDARIHARTKVKTAEGVWRSKRGVNDVEYIKTIENELLKVMSAPTYSAVQKPLANNSISTTQVKLFRIPSVKDTVDLVNKAPTVPKVPKPPSPEVSNEPTNAAYLGIVKKITGALSLKKIAHDRVFEILRSFEIPNLVVLENRPDLIPAIEAKIDMEIAA